MILSLWSCDKENAWDCIQQSGFIIQEEIDVPQFNNIVVNRDVQLFISVGNEHRVTIESGENLLNDISAEVINNALILRDNNTCNLVREYGITKILVQAPDISEIRNSSQYMVTGQGLITYDDITLISEDFNVEGSFNVGDFQMTIDSDRLTIVSNNLSSYFIDGNVTNLNVGFFSGAGRFEGRDLMATNVNIFHRGSNDIIVNPQQQLTGELRSTGNLISVNQPPTVEVDVYYTGELIFED